MHGDLFDVLPTLDPESIDSCVTDPPYGIGFMGREWDTFSPEKARASKKHAITVWIKGRRDDNPNLRGRRQTPAMSPSQVEYNRSLEGQRGFQEWTARWAGEVFRVLKPGAHLVVCGAPRSHHRMMCGLEDAGFEIRDCLAWLFGQGFPKSKQLGAGWGTALKPGHEPIALARKPFKGSITANHQLRGVGGLNVDACRIDVDPDDPNHRPTPSLSNQGKNSMFGSGGHAGDTLNDLGRWPANVLLDAEAAALLDGQTGELTSGSYSGDRSPDGSRNAFGVFGGQSSIGGQPHDGSTGGASRFFYVAKPSREERDYGTTRNGHPTVKPIALMRWLVRLVTPLGGTVLDPFLGSGTTGMACRYELREFIGIEREAEYVEIAERRIGAVVPLFHETA